MSLVMWVIGGLISALGMAVYVEFGTVCSRYFCLCNHCLYKGLVSCILQGLPRSGGSKNYVEYLYRKPELLATCCMAMYVCLLVRKWFLFASPLHLLKIRLYQGWSAANCVVFGECV